MANFFNQSSRANFNKVSIGSGITAITGNPFASATNLTTFANSSTAVSLSGTTILYKDTQIIAYANGSGTSATLSYKTIGNGANIFTNPTKITTVTLSSTTSGSLVGASAFNGCTSLSTVSIARPDVWTGTMGASAFQSKAITLTLTGNYAPATNLTNALPNVSGSTLELNFATINDTKFVTFLNAKSNYTTVKIGSSVSSITGNPFSGATNLSTFTSSNSSFVVQSEVILKTSGDKVICYANPSATTVNIVNYQIGNGANIFTRPTIITSITINCELIGANAFNGCMTMTTAELSMGILGAGTDAFKDVRLTLSNISWSTISVFSHQLDLASTVFRVGDTKTITITNYGEATFAILGFNHDDLTSGGKAGITFGMTELLESTHKMNSSDSNAGGWDASEMRNMVMPSILAGMQSDLQAAIKTVIKKTSEGNQSSTIISSEDKLFLFSFDEVISSGNEGTRYQYYINLESEMGTSGGYYPFLAKKLSNGSGSANYWWLRTAYSTSSKGFREVSASGYIGSSAGPYANASFGVCLGFCI